MSTLQSVLLGALQGVAEFLPISSSGHLVLVRHWWGLGDVPVLYDVLLHVSTLAVVVVVFRRRIAAILGALGRWLARGRKPGQRREEDRENLRLLGYIVLGSIPTAVIGLLISRMEEGLLGEPRVVAALFLVTAAILLSTLAARGRKGYREIGILAVLVIGTAQGIGVFPGISRSGITISAALLLGLQREKAGEYSFLLAIPAIVGALLLQLRQADALLAQVRPLALSAGVIASFVVGLGALVLLLRLVRGGRLPWFAAYLVPLGVVGLVLL
ncbi:MAG: undecaprenyl-diphosphate phosphatase [Spirochaetales bacterium]|nr:undecaprenyl-diphosphate phosphatase [Spirochaetales bacterium]